MHVSEQGSLAEIKVIAHLMTLGYQVFTGVGAKTSFDLIAFKDDILYRVEVKSTRNIKPSGNWAVMLKSVRSNKTQNIIKLFDRTKSDIVAIWIIPEDRIILLESHLIKAQYEITIPSEG